MGSLCSIRRRGPGEGISSDRRPGANHGAVVRFFWRTLPEASPSPVSNSGMWIFPFVVLLAVPLVVGCGGGSSDAPGATASLSATQTGDGTSSASSTSAPSSSVAGDTQEAPGSCGDGVLDRGEECDDGNWEDDDACTNHCTVARCGDGIIQTDVEACDDWNNKDGDGCSSTCALVPSCIREYCEPTPETCPLAAQNNANIQGITPLGAFTGTFAAFSGELLFDTLGEMVVLPAYQDGDLCTSPPRLEIALGVVKRVPVYVAEVPVRFHDGEGGQVDTVAEMTVHECCKSLFYCYCKNSNPFWIELVIEGDGWSLGGTALPNCCRSRTDGGAA